MAHRPQVRPRGFQCFFKFTSALMGLAFLVFIFEKLRSFKPSGIGERLKTFLGRPRFQIQSFFVKKIAQISSRDNDGYHFLLEDDSGKTLFLTGLYLIDLVEKKKFPRREIRISRLGYSNLNYGVKATGTRVEHWPLFSAVQDINVPKAQLLALRDSQIYDRPLSVIIEQLGVKKIS